MTKEGRTMAKKVCQRCGAELKAGINRCPNCGAVQALDHLKTCLNKDCGMAIPVQAKWCPNCGAKQD